jgi:1-acyl-sn-glycerol-3-phosphate acyltransferase
MSGAARTEGAEPAVGAGGGSERARRVVNLVQALARELRPEMLAVDRLGADASLERDFGLDSLARVELALRIERAFGVAISDTAIARADTAADVIRALESAALLPRAVSPPAPPAGVEPAPLAPPAFTTLLEALEWHAKFDAGRTHILLADLEASPEAVTFGALRAEAIAVAAGLAKAGLRPGEAVGIMLPTGREFFAAFFGALYAHGVPVPLYPPARPSHLESHLRRLAGILANCKARVLVTFEAARRAGRLVRALDTRVEMIATPAELALSQASWAVPEARPGDTALLQYTSGSTGRPKGVVLTHANLLANLEAMQRATGVAASDRFVSWLPLYHDMGLIGAWLGALVIGFPLVLMSPFVFLARPVRWLRAIDRYRATVTAAPNFAYELCLNKLDDEALEGLDLGSLRFAFNGAEAVSAHTVEGFAERFARYGLRRDALMPVYGLAECALGLTFPRPGCAALVDRIDRASFLRYGIARQTDRDEPASFRVVSCGRPLPGHAVRIVDPAGAILPDRTQGRIEFQGPSATGGYFDNPEETARLKNGNWLDTGDLGYFAEGELYVTGRAKDIIIRGGHNIHPQELEEAVGEIPGLRRGGIAVFPAADPRSGTERIVVLAEMREAETAGRAELTAQINRLAVDLIGMPVDEVILAAPRTVLKTSSGKVRRAACREAYERGELPEHVRAPWIQLVRLTSFALARRAVGLARRAERALWGLWILVLSAVLAPWLWLAVTTTPGLTRRRRVAGAFARLGRRLSGIVLTVRRPQRPARGPQVYVCNHASYLDAPVLGAVLPADAAFIVKREFHESRLLNVLFTRLGCVFVERHEAHEAVAAARELQVRLQAGESLVVFPEGTFRLDPGLLPFHMGAFIAAAAAHVPVTPVAIRGTRIMLPEGAAIPRPAPLEVILGEPIVPEGEGWDAAVKLSRAARAFLLEHVGEPDLAHGAAGMRGMRVEHEFNGRVHPPREGRQ